VLCNFYGQTLFKGTVYLTNISRGVTVLKTGGSVCTSVLMSHFGTAEWRKLNIIYIFSLLNSGLLNKLSLSLNEFSYN